MSATEFEIRASVERPVRELWCEGCGYGVVVRRDPPDCPMCRQTSWLERAPLARYN
jgi:rubrerythrin